MKKYVALLLTALIIIALGCTTTAIKPKGTFRAALGADPPAIDPANAIEVEGMNVAAQLFDSPVKINAKTMEVEPAVAKSWKISKDVKVFTFNLRKGTKFHNGEEVTADSFKDGLDFIANPKNKAKASYFLTLIEGFDQMQEKKAKQLSGVKALDKYTLEITLNKPSADFFPSIASPAFSPRPKNVKEPQYSKHPIGNGPFDFVSWKRNKEIKLKRFNDYYGQKANIKELLFKIFNNQDTAIKEFEAGNLDETEVPADKVDIIKNKNKSSQKLVTVPLLSTAVFGFNLKNKPWDNKQLRLAIAYALDRKAMAGKAFPEGTKIATSFTSYMVPGNTETLYDIDYDLKKVKELVKQAGYNSPADVEPLTISYAFGGSVGKVAQVAQNQLEKAGFKVKLQGLESGTWLDKMLGGELDFFQMGWVGEPSFTSFLEPIFTSYSIGQNNVTNYSNKEVDSLIEKAQSTLDSNERTDLYKKAERKILSDVPIIPLSFDNAYYLIKPHVKNYTRSAATELPAEQIQIEK